MEVYEASSRHHNTRCPNLEITSSPRRPVAAVAPRVALTCFLGISYSFPIRIVIYNDTFVKGLIFNWPSGSLNGETLNIKQLRSRLNPVRRQTRRKRSTEEGTSGR
ncbi:hypothetical protein MTP99_003553 [Tenebrio molitor]|nr:hypothetical protein MTP99_003553 [Tenebrio molitor]